MVDPDLRELRVARAYLEREKELALSDEDITMLERGRRVRVFDAQIEKLNLKILELEK